MMTAENTFPEIVSSVKPSPKDILRFWRGIPKVRNQIGCWNWTAQAHHKGYGELWFMGRKQKAHRISYLMLKGDISGGQMVCHSCDNPSCVNPFHLWLGTCKENNNDRDRKGRHAPMLGEANGSSKLTPEIVADIKHSYVPRKVSMQSFAIKYGVTRTAIGHIIRGRNWKHIS